MNRRTLIGACALALLAAPMAASAAAPSNAWVVDKAKSALAFRGTLEGTPFDGTFRRWDAQITFDPKKLAASKVVVTIDTASAFTNNPDRDQTLPTDEFFAVKRFPKATFVSTRFVDQGGGRYQAIGELTIKGVKKPVTLPFTLAINGDVALMKGSLVLNRTAFGIGSGRWKTDDEVGLNVTVNVNVTARRSR